MKKIKLKNLRAGQMVEAKHNVIDSHGDLIYKEWNLHTFSKLENLPYYSVKTEDGYSNIVDDDYLNEHFRLPVLTEGKEYECVSSNDNCLTVGKKYKYLMYSGKLYQFECDMYPSEGNLSPHYFEASEVFTHFGIVVGEEDQFYCADWNRCGAICEEQCAGCEKAENMPEVQPPSDPPKPEDGIFEFNCIELADYHSYAVCDKQTNKVVCHLLYENGADYCKEYGNKIADLLNSEQQLQSRIKELEGEVEKLNKEKLYITEKLIYAEKVVEIAVNQQNQALKANGQEEK